MKLKYNIIINLTVLIISVINVNYGYAFDNTKKQVRDFSEEGMLKTVPEKTIKNALSDEMVKKLTPDQLYNTLKSIIREPDSEIVVIMQLVIPLLSTVLAIGIIMYTLYRRKKILHGTIRMMIEKGVPIPPELLAPPVSKKADAEKFYLRNGVLFLSFGLGILAFLVNFFENNLWSLGLIPFFIGIGFLLIWFIDRVGKRDDKQG